jgi:2-polyprenyl-6-methoxyphenol hydroxylase-like FAD-dependent oxidoreductase
LTLNGLQSDLRGRQAIIIGGGIGGLTAAIALRREGIEATVYDRAANVTQIQLGTGIHIWPNAMRGLRPLGLTAAIEAAGSRVENSPLMRWDGKVLRVMHIGSVGRLIGEPAIGILRPELHRILTEALEPEALVLGATFSHYEQDEDGVSAYFTDGREVRADVLIGADGLHSVVREQLQGPAELSYDSVSWLGVVDLAHAGVAPDELSVLWGPGRGFIFFNVGENRISWIANDNVPEGTVASTPDPKAAVLERYKGWAEPVEAIVEATDAAAIRGAEVFDRAPSRHWNDGRVTLLGDAAHPMIPMISQGACQAIEDAVVLTSRLVTEPDIGAALAGYTEARFARASGLQKRARLLAVTGKWKRPPSCSFRDRIFIQGLGFVAQRLEADTFAYDVLARSPLPRRLPIAESMLT